MGVISDSGAVGGAVSEGDDKANHSLFSKILSRLPYTEATC